jgi:hypothetical protein
MSEFGDPSQDPPGTCRWRNPRDSGPWIKVADNRWAHVGGGGGQDDEVVAEWPIGTLRAPAPVDWPLRFRAAADAAGQAGRDDAYGNLQRCSYWLEEAPPHVVEAIGWALLGEVPPR